MLALSIDTADRAELGVGAGLNARLKAFSAHFDVRLSRRADELAREGESERGVNLLITECGSGREAKAAEERERVCTEMPQFEDALANGSVSAEHLDVLARHTTHLTDAERSELHAEVPELLDAAVRDSAGLFERDVKNAVAAIKARTRPDSDVEELARQRAASSVKRWTDKPTGMKMTLLALDPIRDASLHAVVAAELAALRQDPSNAKVPFDELQTAAFVAAVSGSGTGASVPEIVIHTDAGTACEGRHAHTLCETIDGEAVPVATMQRFCCEAVLTAVIVEADGTVRNLVEQRTANRQQRKALSAMYCHVRPPRLLGGVLQLPDPPHRVVDEGRHERCSPTSCRCARRITISCTKAGGTSR